MPKIENYSASPVTVSPQTARAQAVSFGSGEGMARIAGAMGDASKVAAVASDRIYEIERRRVDRFETINRVRDSEAFYKDAFDEFNKTNLEGDLVNPATLDGFTQSMKKKASEYVAKHSGSVESKMKLEAEVLARAEDFSRQMAQNSINAQRKFIMSKAGDQINSLAQEARNNPAAFGDVLKKANFTIGELSPALYPEDEISLTAAAQEAITLSAVTAYTDSGQYEDARDLINENPFFLKSLSPDSQRNIVKTIQSGIEEKDRQIREVRNKINAIRGAASELGIDVPANAVFSAATGISDAQTPQGKIEAFAKVINKKPEELPPSTIAKIGFGVDLPSAEIDYNKDYLPDGSLTPKGIAGQIKEPFEKATAVKLWQQQVLGAIGQFRNDGNKQALLTAMIKFQKALDEGAVVREGDIVLQRSAQGLSDRISLWVKPGQAVGNELVDEMESSMVDFSNKALESAKAKVEPYVKDANERGYRPMDYGVPSEAYEQVFGGIKNPKKGAGKTNKSTMTADEFLAQ